MVRIGINGFGRIGRVALRAALEDYAEEVEVVAINTSGSMEAFSWAHLLAYDSVYGRFGGKIEGEKGERRGEIGAIMIKDKRYPLLAERDPAKIPWGTYNPSVVLECTGVFLTAKSCFGHLKAGAGKVVISAPAKDETPMYLMGVNTDRYKGEKIVSNGSCTTNCVAPVVRVVKENFLLTKAFVSTIHAYTSSQELVDGSSDDLRRARAAAVNIVPTSTGAAKAVSVVSGLKGKFDGLAFRVPVVVGSICDFTFLLDRAVNVKRVNQAFDEASGDPRYGGVLAVTTSPLVSTDIIGNPASAIVDLSLTKVVDGNLVKVIAWYDNEWGFACRLLELAARVGQ